MAYVYDYLHDGIGVSWLPSRIPEWTIPRLFLMTIQHILSLLLVFCSCLYIGKRIVEKFQKTDHNPRCGGCNIEEDTAQTDK